MLPGQPPSSQAVLQVTGVVGEVLSTEARSILAAKRVERQRQANMLEQGQSTPHGFNNE